MPVGVRSRKNKMGDASNKPKNKTAWGRSTSASIIYFFAYPVSNVVDGQSQFTPAEAANAIAGAVQLVETNSPQKHGRTPHRGNVRSS